MSPALLSLCCLLSLVTGNHDAKRLYDDLLRKGQYNRYLRPVMNASEKVNVHMGLKLSQIIDVVSRKHSALNVNGRTFGGQ